MCDKENCNCGSNPCCGDCEPWNCVEQAVNDVWSTKEGQIEQLVERAETAAENSEASAQASAGSAAEAKEFRDEAEQAATTAVAAEGIVVGVANSLQDTADKLKQIADELGTAIAGISVVTWYYTAVSDNQTVIPVPTDKNQVDVQAIYVEGARQDPNRGFTYDALNKEITLAEGIPLGMEISIIIGTYSDNPNDFANTLASANGASLIGAKSGQTVQQEIDTLKLASGNFSQALDPILSRLASESGLFVVGSFEAGANITLTTHAVAFKAEGKLYKWTGTLPKTVAAGSTPATAGGIAVDAWVRVDQDTLRGQLASNSGSTLIGTSNGESLQSILDELKPVLNLTELRKVIPAKAGMRIKTYSAAASSIAEIPFGGGEFYSRFISNPVDDGGYIIVPGAGNLVWSRVQTGKVMLDDFGAKPDWSTDNASAIRKALTFGKKNKTVIHCNTGTYLTSETVEIRKGTGLIGVSRTSTVIAKTTNNKLLVKGSGTTADVQIDAFIAILGDIFDFDDLTGASDMSWLQLSGLTLRREGLTGRENAVQYGIWAPKMNTSMLKDLRVECGYFGFWGQDIWSNTFESLQFLGLGVGQYTGVMIDRTVGAVHALSGTSNLFNMVGVAGYQFGFQINSNQYTTMNSCTADGIRPMSGTTETDACPYAFINPHGITMNSCGSEGVSGERLRIVHDAYAVYDSTVVINAYQGQIVPENPKVASPVFRIQSDGPKKLKVTMNSCNFTKDPTHTNQLIGFISGPGVSVGMYQCIYDGPITVGAGAVLTATD